MKIISIIRFYFTSHCLYILNFGAVWDIPEYEYMVVIGEDGMSNPIGFLPNEPVIFTYDHNFGGRYDLAYNFCDHINKALDGTLQAGF